MRRVERHERCCASSRQVQTVAAVLQGPKAMWEVGRQGVCCWARGAMDGLGDGDGRGISMLVREYFESGNFSSYQRGRYERPKINLL